MFSKLLKYDMNSIWRVWWIMAVGVLGLSVVGACVLRFLLQTSPTASESESSLWVFVVILGVLFLLACIFTLVASILVTEILVYMRFYKHFFTDEGYLTFTLPVSRKSLFLSKTLNALIWFFAHVGLLVICLLFFALIAPPTDEGLINLVVFETLGKGLSMIWQAVGAWLFFYVIEALAWLAAAELFSICLIHFCITVGSVIAKKMKLLAAVGIYYAVSMVLSFIFQIISIFFMSLMLDGLIERIEAASAGIQHGAIALILLIVVAMFSAVASVMYCITQNLLERKLNLA